MLVRCAGCDIPSRIDFVILSIHRIVFHNPLHQNPLHLKVVARMWFDEPGERPRGSWFKDHPLETMLILGISILVIVWMSI